MPKGYSHLQVACLGILKARISAMLYLTRPTIARTGITISNVAEQCSTAPSINIGEASYNLYLVSQGLAAV
jgi:hypothetical protein